MTDEPCPIVVADARVEVGVRVERLGSASVTYRLAVFKEGAQWASAEGGYTHVYVERESGRSTRIPDPHRAAMEEWRVTSP